MHPEMERRLASLLVGASFWSEFKFDAVAEEARRSTIVSMSWTSKTGESSREMT